LTILKSIRVVDIDLGMAPQNAPSPIGIINRRSANLRPEPDAVTNQKLTSAKSMGCRHKEGNLG
jgi:hypothetical protein